MTSPGWEYYQPAEEGNPRAGLHAGLWAFATYVTLLVVVLPREHAHTDAFMSGRLLPPAVIVWGLTWVVAHNIKTRLGWWVYPLVVPVATLAVVAFSSAGELVDRAQGRTADGGTRADAGPVIHELAAPETQGDWTRIDNAAVRKEADRIEQGVAQLGSDVDSAVAAAYAHKHPSATGFFMGVNGTIEEGYSLESSLRNALAGAHVDDYETYDPGEAGGVLGCGDAAAEGLEWVTCVWMGNQRAVIVRWDDRSLDPEVAAQLTAELRDLAAAG